MLDNAVKLAMYGESDPEMPILVRFLQRIRDCNIKNLEGVVRKRSLGDYPET